MKKVMNSLGNNNIRSFLDSLTYWQTINLFTVLAQGQSNISYLKAKNKAVRDYMDKEELVYLLEQALNSPDPKM